MLSTQKPDALALMGEFACCGEARDAWRAARQSVSRGIDPSPRHGVGRADTFSDVVAEWIRREYKNRESTLYQTRKLFEKDLLPVWGSRRVDTIVARDIIELLDRIADRGAPTIARRIHIHLHRFFGWCLKRGILTANPMATVDKPSGEGSRGMSVDGRRDCRRVEGQRV